MLHRPDRVAALWTGTSMQMDVHSHPYYAIQGRCRARKVGDMWPISPSPRAPPRRPPDQLEEAAQVGLDLVDGLGEQAAVGPHAHVGHPVHGDQRLHQPAERVQGGVAGLERGERRLHWSLTILSDSIYERYLEHFIDNKKQQGETIFTVALESIQTPSLSQWYSV